MTLLLAYLGIINVVTFVVYAIDKRNAVKNKRRVRVATLLELALAGGSLGALLAMYTFRHKTKKIRFTVGIPVIMAIQAVGLFYVVHIRR